MAQLELSTTGASGPATEAESNWSVVEGSAEAADNSSASVAVGDTEGRLALAKQIGQFIRRAWEGDRRGSSGRDRLRLSSRVYVVLIDYSGNRFDPKVFHSFAPVKQLCKRGQDCGDSLFVGFPSAWEAKAAVREAGFDWPAWEA